MEYLFTILLGMVAGLGGMFIFFKGQGFIDVDKRKKDAEVLLEQKQEEAKTFLEETKNDVENFRKNAHEEVERRADRLKKMEESLGYKEQSVNKKDEKNKELKLKIASIEEELQGVQNTIKRMDHETVEKLSQKAGKKVDELKKDIIDSYTKDLEHEEMEKLAIIEEGLKENAVKQAKAYLVSTMQRLTSPTSVENRAVEVRVPQDHIKGKIVGRDAKNIEEFENLMGPDVAIVFNDMPNIISISCFNLFNRRIAQKAMEKLVSVKGEINKEVIHNAVKEAEKIVNEEVYKLGLEAVKQLHLNVERFDKEILIIIGRLQYRTSYGQNIMKHSIEVAWVAAMLGAELGLDPEVCKIGGFLHDLGKAIDQDPSVKDAHDRLSKEIMEAHGFSWEEVHAAWTHHDAIPQETPEALIVKAADAVSAGRPGARQESIFSYTERIKALEETGNSYEGVHRSFAISAGRELRVLLDPDKIKDSDMAAMAEKMADQIEETIAYPGKIKVNLIRRVEHMNYGGGVIKTAKPTRKK